VLRKPRTPRTRTSNHPLSSTNYVCVHAGLKGGGCPGRGGEAAVRLNVFLKKVVTFESDQFQIQAGGRVEPWTAAS
jgi:hypothetical protein